MSMGSPEFDCLALIASRGLRAMPRTVEIKPSHTPSQLRRLAASTEDANQIRRLLSIAAVLDRMNRADAARIGGMDRQTLRD